LLFWRSSARSAAACAFSPSTLCATGRGRQSRGASSSIFSVAT
jgi:hypothetical protein